MKNYYCLPKYKFWIGFEVFCQIYPLGFGKKSKQVFGFSGLPKAGSISGTTFSMALLTQSKVMRPDKTMQDWSLVNL